MTITTSINEDEYNKQARVKIHNLIKNEGKILDHEG